MKKIIFLFLSTIVTTTIFPGLNVQADESTSTTFDLSGNTSSQSLALEKVPTFDFGSVSISDKAIFLDTKGTSELQVSDLRGSGEGWSVQTRISSFIDSRNDKKSLRGAEFSLKAPPVTSVDLGNKSGEPKAGEVKLDDSPQTVFSAVTNEGMGGWMADFSSEDSAHLSIPSGNTQGSYSAELTWTLLNAPQ